MSANTSPQAARLPELAAQLAVELNEADAALLGMFADFLRERASERANERAQAAATRDAEMPASRESAPPTQPAQPTPSHLNMLNLYLESPSGYPTGSVQHALGRPAVRPPFRTPSSSLSRREVEVLQLIEEGLTNREIAQRIVVEQGTVKRHVHNILSKLNARNRAEAVAKARNPIGL